MASNIAHRSFNPAEYKTDFRDLIKANPDLAAETATKVARKSRNAQNEVAAAEDAGQALMAGFVTLVIMAGAGAWQGGMKAKRDALIADWEVNGSSVVGADTTDAPEPWDHERGVADPCCWWGVIPKMIVVPVVLASIGAVAAWRRGNRKRIGTVERAATMSAGATFGLVVADIASGITYRSKEKKLEAADDISSVKELPQAV